MTMTRPTHTVPTAAARPLAYQHRARLLCAACVDAAPPRRYRDSGAVLSIPAPSRLIVARRACAGCGATLAMPGLFGLGQLAATLAALDACEAALVSPRRLLARHWSGDWGDIAPGDAGLNEDALRDGARLLSVYHLHAGGRVWIITEAGRHATTLLTPAE